MSPTPSQRPREVEPFHSDVPFTTILANLFMRILRYLAIIIFIILIIFFSNGIILVQEGQMAVLVKKTGIDLTNFDPEKNEYRYLLSCPTIAPNPEYKGIQQETLAEGWHYYNPYTWDSIIVPQTKIPAGQVGIKVRLFGKPLDYKNYQVIAKPGEMGIMQEVLMPGQHLINPYAYKVIVVPAVVVPQGHRGVVGNLAAPQADHKTFCLGDFKDPTSFVQYLVKKEHPVAKYLFGMMSSDMQKHLMTVNLNNPISSTLQKEILKELNYIIQSGKSLYRSDIFNNNDILPDVREMLLKENKGDELVQLNRWLIADTFPHELERSSFLVNEGERGVCDDTLLPGTYYFNPYEKQVESIDIRSHQFNLSQPDSPDRGNEITFPSFDGFEISMEGNIEWHIDPERVAEVFVKYKDNNREMKICVQEKIILPNARAFIRIEGSKYMARDFISGLTREKFQNTFFENLYTSCKHEGIVIKAARVTKCTPPDRICVPIQNREMAIRNREKYEQEMEREKEQIKLKMEATRKDFEIKCTQAKTTVAVRTTNAQRERDVAIIGMKQKVEVARLQLEAAKNQAAAILSAAQAEADVIRMSNKAEASGIAEARTAFGTGQNYAQFLLMKRVSGSLHYILANTDSPFLQMFDPTKNMIPNAIQSTTTQKTTAGNLPPVPIIPTVNTPEASTPSTNPEQPLPGQE